MSDRIAQLRSKFEEIEKDFEAMLVERRRALRYTMQGGKAVFDKDALRRHVDMRKSAAKSLADAYVRNLIVAPFIYALIAPLIFLDIFATAYQHVGFRLWRIPRVPRDKYIILDRRHLRYLNWIQKLNCVYCGYANGVLAYVGEIASRTEQYWCPIKHALRIRHPHKRYAQFVDYGDPEELQAKIDDLRERLRNEPRDTS